MKLCLHAYTYKFNKMNNFILMLRKNDATFKKRCQISAMNQKGFVLLP